MKIEKEYIKLFKAIYILLFFCFIVICCFVQYIGFTPYYGNDFVNDYMTGFLNGLFLFPNVFLYLFHTAGLIENSYYFIDLKNHNQDYLFGFCWGFITFFNLLMLKNEDEDEISKKPKKEEPPRIII